MPMAMLDMIRVTGKVKLMAARDSVPHLLIKKVSTRLNPRMVKIPIKFGRLIFSSTRPIGWVSSPCLSFMEKSCLVYWGRAILSGLARLL